MCRMTGGAGMTENRPLVVVSEESVLDEVLRLAAAVGCAVERLPDLASATDRWLRAPLVIVDEAAAHDEQDLPRRDGVLLICNSSPASSTWQRAFAMGAQQVLCLPDEEATLIAALADVVEGPTQPGGRVLAVVGGRGGAGASVLAASVGVCCVRHGGNALLVDCDSLGGGVDLLLGAERDEGLRWPALRLNAGRVSMVALAEALPGRAVGHGRLSFVSCDREGPGPTGPAVSAVIEAGRRAGRMVVCDLPRNLGAAAATAADRADLVVLVVPAEVRACIAAQRVLKRLGGSAERTRVLVRGPAPDGLSAQQVADAVGAPLLAAMRPEPNLDRSLERGQFEPRRKGPLAVATRLVLNAAAGERTEIGVPA